MRGRLGTHDAVARLNNGTVLHSVPVQDAANFMNGSYEAEGIVSTRRDGLIAID